MVSMAAAPATRPSAAALWGKYAQERDGRSREALIAQYAPLVKYVADRLRLVLPPSLDRDDVLGYGTIGLIEAVDRFDPSRGVKFETYAILRIRGAIIDAVRAMDIVPRSARERARQVEQAHRELFAASGRMPSDQEVAARLGVSSDEYARIVQESACAILPLAGFEREENLPLEETLADPDAIEPLDSVAQADLVRRLAAAIDQLPERDRLIVALYYYEELTMREVSEVLSISESRVSQILSRVRLQLRALLEECGVTGADVSH